MENKENLLVILQARMSSSRFPGKVLALINGKPMIFWQILRIKKSKYVSEVVVATSDDRTDDELAFYLEGIGVAVVRGDLENVYERFRKVLKRFDSKHFIRLTADCPLVMPDLIDSVFEKFTTEDCDYISNALNPTYPDGLDIEILKTYAFEKLSNMRLSRAEKEHVTLGIYSRKTEFKIFSFEDINNLSGERWTVDYPEDLEFVRRVYSEFKGREGEFSLQEVSDLLSKHPGLRNKIGGNYRNISLKRSPDDIGFKNE
jgi:spore coat polysaccharide biosynthesis protein SpsF